MMTQKDECLRYWQKQKTDVEKMSLNYTLSERTCLNKNAKYYDLYFTSIDGSRIHAKYICPIKSEPVPIVFDFHDYKGRAQGWFHLTRYIALGYAVVAMDVRGQGGLSEDCTYANGYLTNGLNTIDDMYYRNVYVDAYVLSNIMIQMDTIDTSKIIAFGRGQGGAIAFALSALQPMIKKCSMEYPLLCDIKHAYKAETTGMYEELEAYFRFYDPTHDKENVVFHKLSYIDIMNFVPLVNCEVLLATAMMDKQSPPECQERFYQYIKSPKQHIIFPKHEHELINVFEDENLKFMKFE